MDPKSKPWYYFMLLILEVKEIIIGMKNDNRCRNSDKKFKN